MSTLPFERNDDNIAEYRLELQSRRENMPLVEYLLSQINDRFQFPKPLFFNLAIAVTEAVNNGMSHGNQYREEKLVWLKIIIKSNEIIIEVQDQGEGFNPENLPDPLSSENLLKPGGRGVFLMKELCQSMIVAGNPIGSLIVMSFNR